MESSGEYNFLIRIIFTKNVFCRVLVNAEDLKENIVLFKGARQYEFKTSGEAQASDLTELDADE